MFDLQQFNIQRPEKIRWVFPQVQDVFEGIKSKSLKSFLRKADETLSQTGIRVEYKQLSQAEYLSWLPYYEEKMKENGFDSIANPEWYDKRTEQGKQIEGMFFYQNDKMICSGIFSRQGNDSSSFAFKASEKINLSGKENSSIGAVIDYLYLKEMKRQGVNVITSGLSRNAFGYYNNFGYLDYKLRFGYQPQLPMEPVFSQSVPLSENGSILFYGLRDDHLSLFALQPQGKGMTFEQQRFATPELPFISLEY